MKRARPPSSHQDHVPARGVLGWVRRRVLPKAARLCAFIGVMILIAWITGRVLTDRYQWSQYIWWVPAIWMLASAWVALIVSALLARFALRPSGIFLRPALLFLSIGCCAFLFFGVWHMHRVVLHKHRDENAIRIAHWNLSSKKVDEPKFANAMFEREIDITFISNAHWGDDRQFLLDAFAPYAPVDTERWVNYSYRVHGDPAHFRIEGDAFVASKYPMVRTGMVRIHTPTDQGDIFRQSSEHGWVMFIEFDLSEQVVDPESESARVVQEPEPFIVWFVDLPSAPFAWRQETMIQTASAINSWNGQTWVMGRWVWEQVETDDSFPDPDLIIGDFNTLRGSASLDVLAPNMHDAFSDVGFGRGRSWTPRITNRFVRQPIKLADWHIDLALVGDRWQSSRHWLVNTLDWGRTEHRMQVVDLVKKPSE